ncbi:MAG: RHS repeat protein [Treponema sp.]|nr:RHS repeat protein [Treponema sp.]
MTIEAAVLSFYLLFPVWSEGQEQLAASCGKNISPRNKGLIVAGIEDMLGHPEDAHHDAALVAGEAATIDTSSIPRLMERLGLSSGDVPYYSGKGTLRSLESGVERSSWGAGTEGGSSVYANDKNFVQTVRDDRSRITEKTVWRNAKESKNIKLLRKMSYQYAGDSQAPSFMEDENLEAQTVSQLRYDAAGRVVSEKVFVIWDGRRHPGGSKSYSYDSQGRLASESTSAGAGGVPATRTRYVYKGLSSKPDSFYYEDGMLRSKTEYTAENDWVQTTYFSSRYNIAASYKNGVKVSESVYSDGKLQRTRSYE